MSDYRATTFYTECECGNILEGKAEYSVATGTLFADDCSACGEEVSILDWFERCVCCDLFHDEDEECE